MDNMPYLYPFLWMKDDGEKDYRAQLTRIHDAGCDGVCVESRPFTGFCREKWWAAMDEVLAAARDLGMKVWILDDAFFPTGYANGAIKERHPELLSWQIAEKHVDVFGGSPSLTLVRRFTEKDELIGVFAVRRAEGSEAITGAPIDLSAGIEGNYLRFSLPRGCYRIFFILATRYDAWDYIDMINPASVHVLIDEVYESHYARYADLFGSIITGFFSDEPRFGNHRLGDMTEKDGYYRNTLGLRGMGYPFSEDVRAAFSPAEFLALWYDIGADTPEIRARYADLITGLYQKAFCDQIGDWCREHGVMYVGHIIEDNSTHARFGLGAGHYFRSLAGQDMSGIDIVLHQVIPGFAHYPVCAPIDDGVADSRMFHYLLGQLAASAAALDPKKQGRAMCEVFGAYGWAEDAAIMKWLIDFLLVRGIRYFVPHAFSPVFPDGDCPPHFGAGGQDPQFDAFGDLMRYTSRMAECLAGKRRVRAAILYHAEAEWSNPADYMKSEEVGQVLYDHHILYDIVPSESLADAAVENGAIVIGENRYDCLLIPGAAVLPARVREALAAIAGARLIYVKKRPAGCPDGKTVSLSSLVKTPEVAACGDLSVTGRAPLLRHLTVEKDGKTLYLFFNESATDTARVRISLPGVARVCARDVLRGESYAVTPDENGAFPLTLSPYQSVLWCPDEPAPDAPRFGKPEKLNGVWHVSLAESSSLSDFLPFADAPAALGVRIPPEFSGQARYETAFRADGKGRVWLSLPENACTARVYCNGQDLGTLFAPPYRVELTQALCTGENRLCVLLSNTLANRLRDGFSEFLCLRPLALTETPWLIREK